MRDETELNSIFGSVDGGQSTHESLPQANDYVSDIQGKGYDDLSDGDKIELLESLFIIMKSFVNLGHGLDPVNKLIEEFENSGANPVTMIEFQDAADDE